MYVVTVVQKSSPIQPRWLSEHQSGMFIGIGEAPTMDAANRAALNDLMARISQEIGVELYAVGEVVKSEKDGDFSERSHFHTDAFSGSLLRDIMRRISSSYWEQCRAQTGKKEFNDFYRYYVQAEIDPRFIDSLRTQTITENEVRQAALDQRLQRVWALMDDGEYSQPADALSELVSALQIASSLFYGRAAAVENVTNRMLSVIRSLRITILQPYSEVRPERHYFKYQVTCGGRPASGLKFNFGMTKGWGKVRESAFSDEDGELLCDVLEINSQQADNQITATLDIAGVIERVKGLQLESASEVAAELDRAAVALTRRDSFSTLARRAMVTSGALIVTGVHKYHSWFFRRVGSLDLSMTLTEHNGRDAILDRYYVTVTCWFTNEGSFSNELKTEVKTAEYGLRSPLKVGYSATRPVTLSDNEAIAGMINDLKRKHEWSIRHIQIQMALMGRDDAGNEVRVETACEPILWKRLFEH